MYVNKGQIPDAVYQQFHFNKTKTLSYPSTTVYVEAAPLMSRIISQSLMPLFTVVPLTISVFLPCLSL